MIEGNAIRFKFCIEWHFMIYLFKLRRLTQQRDES